MQKLQADICLIGAGAMGTTLATLLNQLDPTLHIVLVERLDQVAAESTDGWNNAGTGHAAYCELNYTPQDANGGIIIEKALRINEAFETTLQFWRYLVKQGVLPEPSRFINPTPHISFVWGEDNVAFLRKRYQKLGTCHQFADMEFSDDPAQLASWMPLVFAGRDNGQKVAATRIRHGTDVNFGAVSRFMADYLSEQASVDLQLNQQVTALRQNSKGRWHVGCRDRLTGEQQTIDAGFVFIGAGGGALPLLQKSGVAEGKGYGGFPVSGQFLVCDKQAIVAQHQAKVYGLAALGAPPMSVPHLDKRIIDDKPLLLFGPFAGFTTRFLKFGSLLDLPASVKPHNLASLLGVSRDSVPLIRYLIGEVFQSHSDRIESLRAYYPQANPADWQLQTAGQRVQIIKKDRRRGGKLQFGTEMVISADRSLGALLGASPGASTTVKTLLDLVEQVFAPQLETGPWRDKLTRMIPSWGQSLIEDAALFQHVHQQVLDTLKLDQ